MGLATLDNIVFRINPSDIHWNFTIDTSVIDTVGGRVVQVIGATLSDLTVSGFYGQDHSRGQEGESWRLAEEFVKKVRQLVLKQSEKATTPGLMHPPLTFRYPPKDIDFKVYIKDIADEGGGSVTHQSGKFSYAYTLTLFIVQDNSVALLGKNKGVVNKKREQAIASYIARISAGVGWKASGYNDPLIATVPPLPESQAQSDLHSRGGGV